MVASLMIIWPVEYEIFEKEKGKYFLEKLNKTIFFVDEECLQRPVSSVHEEGLKNGKGGNHKHFNTIFCSTCPHSWSYTIKSQPLPIDRLFNTQTFMPSFKYDYSLSFMVN